MHFDWWRPIYISYLHFLYAQFVIESKYQYVALQWRCIVADRLLMTGCHLVTALLTVWTLQAGLLAYAHVYLRPYEQVFWHLLWGVKNPTSLKSGPCKSIVNCFVNCLHQVSSYTLGHSWKVKAVYFLHDMDFSTRFLYLMLEFANIEEQIGYALQIRFILLRVQRVKWKFFGKY